MMRYQRVSPDCLGLPNGRKPTIRPFNAPESDPFRVRTGSISGSTTQVQIQENLDPLPSENPKSQNHHPGGGGGVLLRWGHKKRSRGSRAENHRAVADESSVHSRSHIKIQRRAAIEGAEKIAAAAAVSVMPPPCGGGGYARGTDLRGCMPLSVNNRTVEERSNGQHRPDKRSPTSPPPHRTHHHNKASSASANGFGLEASTSMNPGSNRPSDQETAASGSGGGPTMEKDKVNLEQFEWPRIYVSLSRKEKEDDFLAMKGTKLPQRPKKRAKNVDKSLQYCFPGMWLSDLTRGRYEVREKKCSKKKRRGLKGMESMDSDSE